MSYFHGVYNSEIDTSLTAPIQGSAGLQVIFGTAPIHLAKDPAGRRITSSDGAVIKQQNLRIAVQADFLCSIYRHVGHYRSGRILRQLVGFL